MLLLLDSGSTEELFSFSDSGTAFSAGSGIPTAAAADHLSPPTGFDGVEAGRKVLTIAGDAISGLD